MKVTRRVVDAAIDTAYNSEKGIIWFDIYAGENAMAKLQRMAATGYLRRD